MIEQIKQVQCSSIKGFLLTLCEKGLGQSLDHKIQHPLYVQCILPLLLDGFENKSATEIIYIVRSKSCGYGREVFNAIGDISNRELLKLALESEPKNEEVVNLIVHDYVENLYFGADHLPECLIVELDDAKNTIKESAAFILNNRGIVRDELIKNHKYYSKLYRDYEVWKNDITGKGFSQWCADKGKNYSWVTTQGELFNEAEDCIEGVDDEPTDNDTTTEQSSGVCDYRQISGRTPTSSFK